MIEYLGRKYAERKVWLALNRPLLFFALLLFTIVHLHLFHLFRDKLVVLSRTGASHIVEHFPVAFHLLFDIRGTISQCFEHSLHVAHT